MKRALLLFFLASFTNIWSQEDIQNKIIPPPPNVASLIKYADVPVNTYNGTSQFSIPIHTITEGDLNFPLSLSYYSNGLKVTEEAGWVGLGWTLNGPGVIHFSEGTRSVNKVSNPPIPYYVEDVNSEYPDNYNVVARGCIFKNSSGQNTTYDETLVGSENVYDLYMYNFAGLSGKFIKPNSGGFLPLNRSNIKFKTSDLNSGGLMAIDTDGTKYYFDLKSISNTPTGGNPCTQTLGYFSQNFTYYLTKIVSVNKKEIDFIYSSYTSTSLPSLSQTYSKNGVLSQDGHQQISTNKSYSSTFTTHNNYVISEINTEKTKIKFFTSSRSDIQNERKLNHIAIYDDLDLKKVIRFSYGYFQGSAEYGDWISLSQTELGDCGLGAAYNPSADLKSKRLRLNSVQFTNQIRNANLSEHPIYTFEYDNTPLPYKTSLAQDLWGYFNGVKTNKSLLPDYNELGYYDQSLPLAFINHNGTAKRKASATHMKAGILTKITQPTGGNTQINYEANTFDDLPGTSNQIVDKLVSATDWGNGIDEIIFDVPDIGLYQNTQPINPARLSVSLLCEGADNCNGQSMGECFAFSGHPQDGLYTLLLKQHTNGNWTTEIFDKTSIFGNEIPCGYKEVYKPLTPGRYKIIANYPDDRVGTAGVAMASISIRYKDIVSENFENIGGGLRISSIADYLDNGQKYNEKIYTYTGGKMMTKPVFYHSFNLEDMEERADHNSSIFTQCSWIGLPPDYGTCYEGIEHENNTLYSNPTVQYSFSASGAAVGYDEVAINYGIAAKNGQEVFKYKNQPDRLNDYGGGVLPGIPGIIPFDNGMLKEKIIKENTTPTGPEPTFKIILSENYAYQIKQFKDYWAYKSNFFPKQYHCAGSLVSMIGVDSRYNFLHFYPVKAGKSVLKSKVITNYDPETELPTLVSTVTYDYNSKNQLQQETVTTSIDNHSQVTQYEYPIDLANMPDHPYMDDLINANRIDPPITIKKYEVDETGVEYKLSENKNKYGLFGTLLLPRYVFSKKGDHIIDELKDKKVTYTRYNTTNGNLEEYLIEGGKYVSFIWGYNDLYPIAKIENLQYSTIPPATIQNLKDLSNTDQSGLIDAFDDLRNTYSDAMVTSYTYNHLVGITSMTDPRGYSSYYEYDTLGRLQAVRDQEGHLLSENKYHYKD